MSLHEVSDHTFATINTSRSEHSISLDDIDDDGDVDDGVVNDSESGRPNGGAVRAALGGILGGEYGVDDDEFACSAATLHLFVDDWNDTTIGKSLTKPRFAHPESRCHSSSSSQKHSKNMMNQASIASLNKSRRIASMLYESISEMLHTSHRDVGILTLDSVTKNLESLARGESVEAQQEKLANLLAEGLKDLDELENRSAAPSWGPLSKTKQAMFHKQKDQLVNLLSDVFSKIEELNSSVEESESRNDGNSSSPDGTKKSPAERSVCKTDSSSVSSRSTKKRQSSFHSDVSSITSRTTASLSVDRAPKSNGAMFRLPAALNSSTAKAKSKNPKARPKQKFGETTASAPRPTTAAPLVKPRDCDFDITLQDSFSSFCALDNDDKTPKRPQRRGSFGGAKSDSALDVGTDIADKFCGNGDRQPPMATRSLDDVVAGPRGACGPPRRPGGRRRADVRAAPPQRQRSFDGEN